MEKKLKLVIVLAQESKGKGKGYPAISASEGSSRK
jgi:hypothetical protein